MFVDDYEPEPVRPGRVDKEGDYELMILEVTGGSTKDYARYMRVKCKINYPGEPRVSFFLTEGASFAGRATAMFDTFGIARGNWNTEGWRGKRGYMHIRLRQKDGYLNMEPEFILDENGYFCFPRPDKSGNNGANLDMYKDGGGSETIDDYTDIPF